MSKASAQRPRYIAFAVTSQAPLPRKAVQEALRAASQGVAWREGPPQLTRYRHPHGIARVGHVDQERATAMLAGLAGSPQAPLSAKTLGASGTLKALTTRLGILQERDA